ncbi:O-antigen ligase family protein [Adlercreutzia sp. ZJ154]|uniref:O-antigen ligase family protein n=1 Tax=Adlercreutzia sp. ZJ154 TaxID=2709790 RepID=UPI0013EAD3F5|nr:O-antigen ligase family protein [Adlercreutzia sp. ZJ154]
MSRIFSLAFEKKNLRSVANDNIVSWNHILLYVMTPMPIIDSLNGYLNGGGNEGNWSLGITYRLLVILVCITAICSDRIRRRTLGIYCAVILVIVMPHIINLVSSTFFLTITVKTILPIVCIEAFLRNEKDRRNVRRTIERLLKYWTVLFPLTILVPFILDVGFHTYREGVGYKGFYFAQNDLCFVLVIMFCISCLKVFRKISFPHATIALMNGLCLLLLGMKSGYVFLVLTIIYCASRKDISQGNRFFVLLVIGIGIILFGVFAADSISQIVQRWVYFFDSKDTFVSFASSGRIERIGIVATELVLDYYQPFWFFFGTGDDYCWCFYSCGLIEMDLFDVFFQFGFVGTVFLFGYYASFFAMRFKYRWSWIRILLIFSFAMSFFAGHVINSALSGMLLSVLCAFAWSVEPLDKRRVSKSCLLNSNRFY